MSEGIQTLWDVVHFDAPVVDEIVFLLWIQGYSDQDAMRIRQKLAPSISKVFITTQVG